MATYMIYASCGEYSENADSIAEALAQFAERRPEEFVCAIVDDDMRPRLVLEDGN